MSDILYDSLEDECDDDRVSSDSLDQYQTKSVSGKKVSKFESINRHSSFCFGKSVNKKETNFFPSVQEVPVNASHRNFLPIINKKNSLPGLQALFNNSADFETLAKKGLLLNRDGSFTKSPSSDTEELPFITREYKNLVFQKQKTYNLKKKIPLLEAPKAKKYINEVGTSKCNLCCNTLMNNKKYIEMLTRKKSSSQESYAKLDRNSVTNDNLTDSMKRVLLQNKSQKNREQSLDKTKERQNAKFCHSETKTSKDKFFGGKESKAKDGKPLKKHLSHFSLKSEKQNLTYSERHQLENGYNPMFLRYGVRKMTSDTTRSNFGDSVVGKLSEVSSRVLSVEDMADSEDEEKFYEEIIEKDKNKELKKKCRNNARRKSFEITGSATRSPPIKVPEKITGRGSCKEVLKPLFIDIKTDEESNAKSSKKCSHYCSTQPPPKMSKTELALKGKTYGYLANARNILNFKCRAGEKVSGRENLSPQFNSVSFGLKQSSEFTLRTNKNAKKCSPVLNLAVIGAEKTAQLPNKGSLNNTVGEDLKSFYLPNVSSSEHRNCALNSKNLLKMISCLDCPGHQKDQFSVH